MIPCAGVEVLCSSWILVSLRGAAAAARASLPLYSLETSDDGRVNSPRAGKEVWAVHSQSMLSD